MVKTFKVEYCTILFLVDYSVIVGKYGTPFSHELNDLYFISLKKWLGCYIYVESY